MADQGIVGIASVWFLPPLPPADEDDDVIDDALWKACYLIFGAAAIIEEQVEILGAE